MAIPEGTTARNLETIAGWMLVAGVILGALSWWGPGYQIWGAMTVSFMVVWTLWLSRKIITGDRTVSVHPICLALAVPGVILVYHTLRTGTLIAKESTLGLLGTLNISMVFHLCILGMGVMLCESLLKRISRHAGIIALCGGAMMGGTVVGIILGANENARGGLGLVGFAGVAIWVSTIWTCGGDGGARPHPLESAFLRTAVLLAGGLAAGLLAWSAPLEAVICTGLTGLVLGAGAIILPGKRTVLLLVSAVLVAVAFLALISWGAWEELQIFRWGAFGGGEDAVASLPIAQSGLGILAGATGWTGVGGLIAGITIFAGRALVRARALGSDEQVRVMLWTLAVCLTGAALLGRGGWNIPSVTLSAGFVWGLAPAILRTPVPRVSGVWVMVILASLLILLGFSRHGGLISWISEALGGSDMTMHVSVGFFLSLVLAWLMGTRKVRLGVLAVVIVAIIGGAGEFLQGVFSKRSVQFADWAAHLVGCGVALPLYLLCLAARWCESPDARKETFGK